MYVNGSDCRITIETSSRFLDIPYVSETIRENILLLQEEVSIEGSARRRGKKKSGGVTGCVVSMLTLKSVPYLFYFAFGVMGNPVFVSGTRNLYQYRLELCPFEDAEYFNVIQTRNTIRGFKYEDCRVNAFELRIEQDEFIKLRLDIASRIIPKPLLEELPERDFEEPFFGYDIRYSIKDVSTSTADEDYDNIYGVTIQCKKDEGAKTEVWIKRVLENEHEIPNHIEELVISVRLFCDKYEDNQFGRFTITLNNLVLISDETNVESSDAVIGMLRYHVNGFVSADVFTEGENFL